MPDENFHLIKTMNSKEYDLEVIGGGLVVTCGANAAGLLGNAWPDIFSRLGFNHPMVGDFYKGSVCAAVWPSNSAGSVRPIKLSP